MKLKPLNTIRFKIIFILFLASLALNAYTQTNFSGQWEFDKIKSDQDERGDASLPGIIILEIIQNPESITFTTTYFPPGKEGRTMTPFTYPLDGTVTKDNSGSDPAIKFSEWSKDNKILTTNYLMTAVFDGAPMDFLTAWTYSLSEDGKTLTLEELHKSNLNGEKKVKKVYNKK
jgi:hypothetical protein